MKSLKRLVTRKAILSAALVFLANSAWAKREMILFGGGGEPEGATTIFDETLENNPMFDQKSGWRTQVYYDGGHANSEELATRISDGNSQPMTKANVDAALESLKQRIISGDLKADDQLMIAISTHGAQQTKGQRTHSVATTDGTFDLDKLIEIRDLAEEKGIRLAITDFSCHSGPMLDLGTDKTCVLTAANDDVGYSNTGLETVKAMKTGSNLETAFLEGRKAANNAAPQISTEAGKRAYADTNFISEITLLNRRLDEVLAGRAKICAKDQGAQFKELNLQIQALVTNPETSNLLRPLDQALRNYEDIRLEIQTMDAALDRVDEKVCEGNPQVCLSRTRWKHEMRHMKPKRELLPSEAYRFELAQVVAKTKKQKRFVERLEALERKHELLNQAAQKIFEVERTAYSELYQYYSSTSTKPNPCKDFKL